ncbi:hypothetical protein GDO81_019480 [Engystomops pustulosus]|uniref:Uncharacterized protein n=1 Tax=Engystomops pustulosus TaxID=76066 RepID=A0AAV6YYP3_ENGPU|nr:hypothetical protein GDO81_019480 [Engystomops pustulosus]
MTAKTRLLSAVEMSVLITALQKCLYCRISGNKTMLWKSLIWLTCLFLALCQDHHYFVPIPPESPINEDKAVFRPLDASPVEFLSSDLYNLRKIYLTVPDILEVLLLSC